MTDNRRVLLVDDDELIRTTVSKQLRDMGFAEITQAEDGPSAKRALDREDFDLIISDLMLPGIDGVEFLREVARAQPRAALIVISALEERIVRSVALLSRERGLRVLGALGKPVRPEALRQLIESQPAEPVAAPAAGARPNSGDVLRGLEAQDISLRMQPALRVTDRSLHSVECLLQWDGERIGRVAPQELVRIAEKNGLAQTLAEYSLELALHHAAAWTRAGLSVPVSVNISASVLKRLDLPDRIDRLVRLNGLSPAQLTLEISERSLSDEPEVLDVLTRLRMREVRITLDHYTSGHSSLVRLQRLPINAVKIDRSFVRCLGSGKVGTTIVEYGIKMAKALGLETIAVGVETAAQAEQLCGLGCDVLQGNFLAPPMAAEEVPAWSKSARAPEQPAAAVHEAEALAA